MSPRYHRLAEPGVAGHFQRWFRRLNRFMVLSWRLGLGPMFGWFPATAGRIMVIHHVGRRTGRTYRSPVNYAEIHGELFCVAAFGAETDWYKNLMADGRTEAWLPGERWTVEADDASDGPDRVDVIRQVLISSGFAAPAVGLHPREMSPAELGDATADYRLIRIRRLSRIDQSVADLRWAWLLGIAVLLVLRSWRVRR